MIGFINCLMPNNSKREIKRPGDLAPCGAKLVYGHDHSPQKSLIAARHCFRAIKKIR
jgi:hypothetical protein